MQMTKMVRVQVHLIALLVSSWLAGSAAGYGLDCSFPVHNQTFSDNCDGLEGRRELYETYMEGCAAYYDEESCVHEEGRRLLQNRNQPQSMVNYTSGGFRKVVAPPALQKLLWDFWENNKDNAEVEEWYHGNIYTNHWAVPTNFVSVEKEENIGGGQDLVEAIWDVAQEEVELWTGIKMRPSSVYGIRIYNEGAILSPHVDRLPLVSSCIVNVAQDVDEDWPLEVYNRFGEATNITMRPFDMVFYESHSLIHGRPFALKGRYFASIFIHFEAMGESLQETGEGQEEYDEDSLLPPYIIPDSPWAEEWLEDHPTGWSKEIHEEDEHSVMDFAAYGQLEELEEYLDAEPELVNYVDEENGWQPLHEAVYAGHFDTVKFLIERGADIHAQTNEEQSVLNLAKMTLGLEDPITRMLMRLGADDAFNGYYHNYKFRVPREEEEDDDEEDENGEEEGPMSGVEL